nr:hypothetical protein [Gammaproteobacteria bacterium]
MRMSLFPNQASQSEPRYTATQIRTAFEDSNHQGEFFQLINEIASSAEYKVDAMREELEPVWEELLTRMPNAKYLSDEISELKSHQFSEQLSDEGSMRFTARHPFEVIAGLVLFSGAWNFTQLASNTELSETDRAVYSADARFWLIRGVKYNDFFCIDNKSKTLREAILSTDEKGNGIITDTDIEQLDEYNQQAIQYHGSVGMLLAAANYCCLVKYFIRAIKRTADSKGIGIAGLFAQEPE